MDQALEARLRAAIQDSEVAGPNYGVVISQRDARRLLYRLIKENDALPKLIYRSGQ